MLIDVHAAGPARHAGIAATHPAQHSLAQLVADVDKHALAPARRCLGFEPQERWLDTVGAADRLRSASRLVRLSDAAHTAGAHQDVACKEVGITVLAMLQWLGSAPPCSRPRAGNDNPFVENQCRKERWLLIAMRDEVKRSGNSADCAWIDAVVRRTCRHAEPAARMFSLGIP